MTTPYFIIGKRFQAKNLEDLEFLLTEFELTINLESNPPENTYARKMSEPFGTKRYKVLPFYDKGTGVVKKDFLQEEHFDVIVGKVIPINRKSKGEYIDIDEINLPDMVEVTEKIKQDFPKPAVFIGRH
ncbi:hypothetical protein GOV12_03890 [Candidatus Pacearchaeota archaeon]|nr:hypothetical protein [Candidatus Pacearchaeota archaeon]